MGKLIEEGDIVDSMADFNFLHVFGGALLVTTLKNTLFNPSSLLKTCLDPFMSTTIMGPMAGKNRPSAQPKKSMMESLKDAQRELLKNRPELAEAMGKTNLLGASDEPKRRKTKEEKEY